MAVLPPSRRAQAVKTVYVKADINHVVLTFWILRTGAGGVYNPDNVPAADKRGTKDIPAASLDSNPVATIRHLRAFTDYRMVARAYKAAGTAAADLISVDSQSAVDLNVQNDDQPAAKIVPVKLLDQSFDGTGSVSLGVVDGVYTAPPDEVIQ